MAGAEFGFVNITSEWYDSGTKEPHNTDGIDPGGNSHDIWIHDTYIHNGDDSVAIKPGTAAEGCTRNILVENCHFEKGHGCSIGSVGKGCVENVIFRNVTMNDQQNGCRIKSYSDEEGYVRNITWTGIKMERTSACITVNAQYKPTPKGATHFISVSDIHFNDITGSGCKTEAEFLCPAQSPCTGIELSNVDVSGGKAMNCENAFGHATGTSIASCLKDDKPTPHPPPTPPPPAPKPTPTPPSPPGPAPSCDVNKCIARCVTKYGGSIADQGPAYYCGKGCAGLKGGKVEDENKFCKIAESSREAKCEKDCSSASSNPDDITECKYGCGFWA